MEIEAVAKSGSENARSSLRVLYLTTVVPSGERTGGEIATQNFVTALRDLGCTVKVLGYNSVGRGSPNENERVVGIRPIESGSAPLAAIIWLVKSLVKRTPYTVEKFVGAEYLDALSEELKAGFDIFVIDHSQMGWLINHLPQSANIIFNTQNVENILYSDLAKHAQSKFLRPVYKREAALLKTLEHKWAQEAEQVWTLTDSDKRYFSAIVEPRKSVYVFGLPGPTRDESTVERHYAVQRDIAIIGTWTWYPNAAGLIWFVKEVLPLLNQDITISVAGSGAAGILSGVERIEYLGFVPSAPEFLLSSKIICIPARQGGGIQIKSIESLALGMPVVATGMALRGIEDLPEWVYLADDATEFSQCISKALTDRNVNRSDGLYWRSERRKAFSTALEACLESY